MRMQTNAPARKVNAAALGAAVATIVIWMLEINMPDLNFPEPVKAAITTVVVFAFGYLTPPSAKDTVVPTTA